MDRANLPAHGLAEMPKSPRFSPNAARVIDVLTYSAVQLLDVRGPIQVFDSANDLVAGGRSRRLDHRSRLRGNRRCQLVDSQSDAGSCRSG
jgi:hypothetical protein